MSVYSSQASGSVWFRSRKIIPASSITELDKLLLVNTKSIDYIITAFNDIEIKTKTFNLKVFKEGTTIKESLYLKIGTINVKINIATDTDYIILNLQNDELFDLTVNFARLSL